MDSDSFRQWVQKTIEDRGWSQNQAAKRAGVSPSMVQQVVAGTANPGLDFYRGIARAFKMRLEDVLRLAGVLPPLLNQIGEGRVGYSATETAPERLATIFEQLDPADRDLLMLFAQRLAMIDAKIVTRED